MTVTRYFPVAPVWPALNALAVVLLIQSAVWVVSVRRTDASLVDRWWGVLFAAQAWTYVVVGDGWTPRAALAAALVSAWAARLSLHITVRNWGDGEDRRYAAMRARDPDRFPLRSLVTVFGLQGVLAWVIAVPLFAVGAWADPTGAFGVLDVVAVAVWAVGLYFEAVGDWQLQRFLADPANRGRVLDMGLWRYTRHPNYFGDTVVWLGYGLLAVAAGAWWGLVGPVLMWLFIVNVSGVALTDRQMSSTDRKREGYDEYVARTNAFFPGPPRGDTSG